LVAYEVAHSLRADGFDASEDGTGRGTPLVATVLGDVSHTLTAYKGRGPVQEDGTGRGAPIVAFSCKDHGADAGDLAPTLRAMEFDGSHANAGGQLAIAYGISSDAIDRSGEGADGTAAVRAGLGIVEDASPTLRAGHANAVAFNLRGRENGAQPEIDGDGLAAIRAASGGSSRSYVATSAVRRLTPVECEKLQGFPPNYTLVPYRKKPAADGPRYRALGNSFAVPVVRWIGERIAAIETLLD
jgi:DNA (cytosine-5)-methyltransferase 1